MSGQKVDLTALAPRDDRFATQSENSDDAVAAQAENRPAEYESKSILGDLPYPTRNEWIETETKLKDKRLLNKQGAITTAGQNAR